MALSLDNLIYLFMNVGSKLINPFLIKYLNTSCGTVLGQSYLFMNVGSKLFFKMHLFLQISTDHFHIRHESSLGVPHSACARRGDMALSSDLATINKMVLYIVTQQISLWIRLCGYVGEVRGSDATVSVRARIHKHTLVHIMKLLHLCRSIENTV